MGTWWVGLAALLPAGEALAAPVGGCLVDARGSVPVRPQIPNAVSVVSEQHPVRVWYDPTHVPSTALAPEVIDLLDGAWDAQVDRIGFRPPVLPDAIDGPELDVYLVQTEPLATYVAADAEVDAVAGDGHNSAPAFVIADREMPLGVAPAAFAHAFNHVLQFATDFSEPSLAMWEGTATAAQEWTVGADLSHWAFDVPSYQEVPSYPALTGDSAATVPATGLGATYEFGAALFVMFLDEKLTAGAGAGGVGLWETAANEGPGGEPDGVDAFSQVAGMGLGSALGSLAVVRFLTGDDWDPRGLGLAKTWAGAFEVPRQRFTGVDLPMAALALEPAPMITGTTYVDIDLTAGIPASNTLGDPWLSVTMSSASTLDSGLVVLVWAEGVDPYEVSAVGDAPQVLLPIPGLTRIAVAATNLGPPGWDGDDDPYVAGDQTLAFAVVDRSLEGTTGATTGTVWTTGPDAPPVVADDPEEPRGCGCASGGIAGTSGSILVVAGALLRRQPRSRRTDAQCRILRWADGFPSAEG